MNEQMRLDLIRLVKEQLGEQPSVEQVITHLESVGVVKDGSATVYVVGSEFFRIMALPKVRTARDIELELSALYDLHEQHVKKVRLKFHELRASTKRGRKTK